MRPAPLLVAAAAVAAVALLAFARLPGEPEAAARTGAAGARLSASVLASAANACELCHYEWTAPFHFEGERSAEDAEGSSEHSITLRPVRDYLLWDVRATPLAPGAPLPPPATEVARPIEPLLGGSEDVAWRVTSNLTTLAFRVLSDDGYSRPDLRMVVLGPGGVEVEAEGARNHKIALLARPPPGDYVARVTYADGSAPSAPASVVVSESRGEAGLAPRVAMGENATFTWRLPAPGRAGAPSGFLLSFRAHNPHPTERWNLDAQYDASWFTVFVPAEGAEPPGPRAWSEAEIAAVWEGKDRVLLYEEALDEVRLVVRSERGEWNGARHAFAHGPAEAANPALPPGTRLVRAHLEWEKRTPASPDPTFEFAVSRRPFPDFTYPDATSAGPGTLTLVLPVEPSEWEEPGSASWLQVFARLALEDGFAAFDGRKRFVVEALREEPAGEAAGASGATVRLQTEGWRVLPP